MSNIKSQLYAELFEAAMNSTLKAAEKVPVANRYRNVQEGKAHPLWLIGHLAGANNSVVNMWCCGGESIVPKELRTRFAPDFAKGDPIVTDPSKYPSWDEVVGLYKAVGEKCVAGIRAMSDADLQGELKNAPDTVKQSFGTIEKTLRGMIAHDSHHRGQLAMLAALK